MNQIQQKQLQKLLRTCYGAAQEYVNIVSESAIEQMKSEGIEMTIENMNLPTMSVYAAKKMGVDPKTIIHPYSNLMILLGYAEHGELEGGVTA